MRFKLIVVTVRTDLTERIVEAGQSVGATGATILPARGASTKKAKTFFGLSLEVQRDVILFLVSKQMARAILERIHETHDFSKPGTGIVFVLDAEQLTGLKKQKPHLQK
ncbi:MAG: P-II family nitrogen regulator [Magnetococcus sp. DMHC-6]